jgi:hypothetical protein
MLTLDGVVELYSRGWLKSTVYTNNRQSHTDLSRDESFRTIGSPLISASANDKPYTHTEKNKVTQ